MATITHEFELPPFDSQRVLYRFYKADPHGATPNEWRCIVTVMGTPIPVNKDIALSELGLNLSVDDALFKALYDAALG